MKRREVLSLGSAMLGLPSAWALPTPVDSRWEQDFGDFINDGMKKAKIPGLGIAMLRHGQTLFVQGYGFANVTAKTPVTANTSFHIASVSKVVTGTAMMMLLEQGAYCLDDPIRKYLDFPVVHPQFPEIPITFRELFTHTSGISEAVYYKTPEFLVAGDPSLPLRDFLTGYLSVGGRWYEADGSFTPFKPGAKWQYSSVAIALLGYLASRVGTQSLDTLTRDHLFQPLRMTNTAWKFAEVLPTHLAVPYEYVEGQFRPLPPTGYPDWPAGMLRTSPRDFARFLTLFTNLGIVDNFRYMKKATVELFFTTQPVSVSATEPAVSQALIWRLRNRGAERVAEQAGGDPGAASVASVDLPRGTGALAFANIALTEPVGAFLGEIITRLHYKARTA